MTALANVSTTPTAFDTKIVIYVEGEDDVQILAKYWFGAETNVHFQSVGGKTKGGCRRVVDVVNGRALPLVASHRVDAFDQNAPQDTTPTFGIVDRDYLHFRRSPTNLFFELDDVQFHRGCGQDGDLGQKVRVLRRWEIESYLVADARVVSDVIRNEKFGDSAYSNYDEVSAASELLRHGEALIPIVAANLALHTRDAKALDEGFGLTATDRARIVALVDQKLGPQLANDAHLRTDIDSHTAAIEQFAEPARNHPPATQWERFNRMIDAKRILARLRHHHKTKDLRGHLADKVRTSELIDPEFRDHIAYFRRLAAQGTGATRASVA